MTLTQERLRELLHYDPDTGLFTWKVRTNGRIQAGTEAGTRTKRGYIVISVDVKKHKAHRLAWFYTYGTWPTGEIDHVDEDWSNNRISNLRNATHSQNEHNQSKPSRNNTTGYRGVDYDKRKNRYRALIKLDGDSHFLGLFATAEEASEAYLAAKAVLHPFWVAK